MTPPFWKQKSLEAMTPGEWESLCDGCGKCCLAKMEDEDTAEIYWTSVGCKLLDKETCQCSNYVDRKKFVPDCVRLTPKKVREIRWLPRTCAYRLVADGEDLPEWHHLVSGSRETVHTAGISMKGRITALDDQIAEDGDYFEHMLDEEP